MTIEDEIYEICISHKTKINILFKIKKDLNNKIKIKFMNTEDQIFFIINRWEFYKNK